MITEQYVSFETAKLLKEKGFSEPVHYNRRNLYPDALFYHRKLKNFNGPEYKGLYAEWFSAPTQQMAMRWLREVHNYNIEVDTIGSLRDKSLCYRSAIYYLIDENECFFQDNFNSYEEACEAAIKYCLENLI